MSIVLDPTVVLDVARIFPHEEGQTMWWESYSRRTPAARADLLADLQRRIQRDEGAPSPQPPVSP